MYTSGPVVQFLEFSEYAVQQPESQDISAHERSLLLIRNLIYTPAVERHLLIHHVRHVAPFKRLSLSVEVSRKALPDKRDKTKLSLQTIFGIAGQFLAENLFLVKETQNDERNEQRKSGQSKE